MPGILRRQAAILGALAAAVLLAGAGAPSKRRTVLKEPKKPLKAEETIGDLGQVISASEVRIEGVGLVVGLDGTGSDPEPSYYRQKLVDEMRKADVPDIDKILASKTVSLVVVRGRIPAGVTTKDRLDVDIDLTPSSTTTSLAGGRLLATRMYQIMLAKNGEAHESSQMATAGGPVMTGSEKKPDDAKLGRVLGGCRVKKDMPFVLTVDDSHKSKRTVEMIQRAVNTRFHQQEGVEQKGMADPKTDEYLTLKVPKVYHHNQDRYFRVVKLLAMIDTPDLRAARLERWGRELMNPKTSGLSAMRLEGMGGPNAVDALKRGLTSENAQVRFFAAEALAYLDDSAGVDVLARTAVELPIFRPHALAALAAMDQSASTLRLRKLMDHPDVEVRYGAFNSLRTQNADDPFLGRVPVVEVEPEPEADEPLQAQIARPRRRRARPDDPFALYVVDSEGPPLVHVSASRRCEIVVFGKGQRLLTPVVLGGGGAILLNASDGDPQLQITRIVPGSSDDSDPRVLSPLELGEVIRETARLGATYPEIVNILASASKQKNLAGPLFVDAVPAPSPKYTEALLLGIDQTAAKKDEAVAKTKAEEPRRPSLLDRLRGRTSR